MPALDDLAQQYAKKDLVVLAINVENSSKGYKKWIESNPSRYLVWAHDNSGEISESYRVRGLPTTYVLDQEGIIRHAHVGWGGKMQETLSQEFESLFE